ncbi:unnamed protein product, partial [Discosporangium mesarthrocarpum]
ATAVAGRRGSQGATIAQQATSPWDEARLAVSLAETIGSLGSGPEILDITGRGQDRRRASNSGAGIVARTGAGMGAGVVEGDAAALGAGMAVMGVSHLHLEAEGGLGASAGSMLGRGARRGLTAVHGLVTEQQRTRDK